MEIFMKILLTTLGVLYAVITYGQMDSTHQIDLDLIHCLDSKENYSTKGMTDCVYVATKKWDIQLNKTYKKLLTLLTFEQKELLKIAQKEWIIFRDKEIDFSNQFYSDLKGTMWIPVAAQQKMDLTKQRVIELDAYFNNLE